MGGAADQQIVESGVAVGTHDHIRGLELFGLFDNAGNSRPVGGHRSAGDAAIGDASEQMFKLLARCLLRDRDDFLHVFHRQAVVGGGRLGGVQQLNFAIHRVGQFDGGIDDQGRSGGEVDGG